MIWKQRSLFGSSVWLRKNIHNCCLLLFTMSESETEQNCTSSEIPQSFDYATMQKYMPELAAALRRAEAGLSEEVRALQRVQPLIARRSKEWLKKVDQLEREVENAECSSDWTDESLFAARYRRLQDKVTEQSRVMQQFSKELAQLKRSYKMMHKAIAVYKTKKRALHDAIKKLH